MWNLRPEQHGKQKGFAWHQYMVQILFVARVSSQSPIYCKNPKISNTRKFAVITLKVEQDYFSLE